MKYQCDRGHKFIHPAKFIRNIKFTGKTIEDFVTVTIDKAEATVETYFCPYCLSLDYSEFVESQPEITSVLSVPLEDVDAKLAEGYMVESLYAKTATLVKRTVKEETIEGIGTTNWSGKTE